ncbi:MAG: tRNA pseudouridine(13) synthase TruD [Thermoplasmatota archaeon]
MESKIGIELFFTDTPGIGGRLKKYPEDFEVEEIIDLPKLNPGEYTLAKVWTRNWETNRLVRVMAKSLNISRNEISFAGTKDKRAITVQWMSFKAPLEKVEELNINDVEILDVKSAHRSLYIGAHLGNQFKITVRDIDKELDEAVEIVAETSDVIKNEDGFPNWFGIQRFGALRPITHEVGKYIVKGDYEKAVQTYVANPFENEDEICYKARVFLEENWDPEEALKIYPDILFYEKEVLSSLVKNPENYVKALKKLPHNLLTMFIHAYQSFLFNKMVSLRLKRGYPLNDVCEGDIILPTKKNGLPNKDTPVEVKEKNLEKCSMRVREGKGFVSAPLFGTRTYFSKGIQGQIEREVIEEEGLHKDDFAIPEMSSISSSGTRREIFAVVRNLEHEAVGKGIDLSFSLNKGSYATTLMREFMKLSGKEIHKYT